MSRAKITLPPSAVFDVTDADIDGWTGSCASPCAIELAAKRVLGLPAGSTPDGAA